MADMQNQGGSAQNGENLQMTENPAHGSGKTFTQAEVDAIVGKRVSKALKGMPDDTELAAFRAWKDTQQTEQQRMNTITQERDTARNDLAAANEKLEQYERERYIIGQGVPAEDADYYVFKAKKLVSDTKTFEQAAAEVIAARKPQQQTQNTVRVDFGGSLAGGIQKNTANEAMNALIRGARK